MWELVFTGSPSSSSCDTPDKMVHLFIFVQPFFEGLDKEGQLLTPHFVRISSRIVGSELIKFIWATSSYISRNQAQLNLVRLFKTIWVVHK